MLVSKEGHFVDTRIYKPPLGGAGAQPATLQWAFAGKTDLNQRDAMAASSQEAMLVKWKIWIDSTLPDARSGAEDVMYYWHEPNGGLIQKGTIEDPESGESTDFEVLWAPIATIPYEVPGGPTSVVFKFQDRAEGGKGLVVRVGNWCQGLLKVGGQTTIERWVWDGQPKRKVPETEAKEMPYRIVLEDHHFEDNKDVGGDYKVYSRGRWIRIAKLGDDFIPCSLAFLGEMQHCMAKLQVGTTISFGTRKWRVVELGP